MIVVADTTPVNYLILIDEIDILPLLFETVILPQAVSDELLAPQSPPKVRAWLRNAPTWLQVRQVTIPAPQLAVSLDAGEREAIQLAFELGIDTILMDEAEGRRYPRSLRFEVRGTLGILEQGALVGKTSFRAAIAKLLRTNFRVSASILDTFLSRNP